MKKLLLIALLIVGCHKPYNQDKINQNIKGKNTMQPKWENKEQSVSIKDLEILKRAKEILSDESKWNNDDNRVCNENDTKWSLFCALKKATIETLGEYDHRRVALMEVRWIIHKLMEGEDFKHRLMDFNNTRTFNDITNLLDESIQKVEAKLQSTLNSTS
tara:strand:- start:187 stop:666 length:480 start_codon:yes stop_codon:yes gene_type:complete